MNGNKFSTKTIWSWQEVPTCGAGWTWSTSIAYWQIKTLPLLETIDTGVSWWIRVVNDTHNQDLWITGVRMQTWWSSTDVTSLPKYMILIQLMTHSCKPFSWRSQHWEKPPSSATWCRGITQPVLCHTSFPCPRNTTTWSHNMHGAQLALPWRSHWEGKVAWSSGSTGVFWDDPSSGEIVWSESDPDGGDIPNSDPGSAPIRCWMQRDEGSPRTLLPAPVLAKPMARHRRDFDALEITLRQDATGTENSRHHERTGQHAGRLQSVPQRSQSLNPLSTEQPNNVVPHDLPRYPRNQRSQAENIQERTELLHRLNASNKQQGKHRAFIFCHLIHKMWFIRSIKKNNCAYLRVNVWISSCCSLFLFQDFEIRNDMLQKSRDKRWREIKNCFNGRVVKIKVERIGHFEVLKWWISDKCDLSMLIVTFYCLIKLKMIQLIPQKDNFFHRQLLLTLFRKTQIMEGILFIIIVTFGAVLSAPVLQDPAERVSCPLKHPAERDFCPLKGFHKNQTTKHWIGLNEYRCCAYFRCPPGWFDFCAFEK